LKNLRQIFFFVSPHLCPHFFKPCGVACKVFPRLDAVSPVLESLLEAFANFCVQNAARIACNCSWSCWCHEISFPSLPGWVLKNIKIYRLTQEPEGCGATVVAFLAGKFAQTEQNERQHCHGGATHLRCTSSQVIFALSCRCSTSAQKCWFNDFCLRKEFVMHISIHVAWSHHALYSGMNLLGLGYKTIACSRLLLCFLNILRASVHWGNWRPQCTCSFEGVSHVLSRKSVAQLASALWGCDWIHGNNFSVYYT